MSSLNSNHIIIEAKNQYTMQLIDTLAPFIFSGLKSIYGNCKSLKKFQEELCNIPKWNQVVIDNEYDRIIKYSKCDWLDKLIESVFVCNVKILTSINSNNNSVFKIKIPDTKAFVHACYIEAARNLYTDPYLIADDEDTSFNKKMKECLETVGKSIEKTIYHFIPKQEIIEQCLNEYKNDNENENENENENDKDSDSDNDSVDKNNNSDHEHENENENKNENEGYKSNNVHESEYHDQNQDEDGFKTINEQRNDILMHEPDQDLGTPCLDTVNRVVIPHEENTGSPDEIVIPGNSLKKESKNDDYFFSSDED